MLNPSAQTKRRLWETTPTKLRESLLRAQTRLVNRNLQRQVIPSRERERLMDVFGEEVAKLESRFGRDLSDWVS